MKLRSLSKTILYILIVLLLKPCMIIILNYTVRWLLILFILKLTCNQHIGRIQMLNKLSRFSPLSLSSGAQAPRGGALRHPPQCSVFTRFFSLLLAVLLCFVFISGTVTTHVSAASVSVPIGNWLPSNIYSNYGRLNEDQKRIADMLTGGMGTAYNGLQDYRYRTIQATSSALQALWEKYGSKVFEYTSPAGWQLYIREGLSDVLGSIVSYASRIRSSFSDWLDDFFSGDESFTIPYSQSLNQDFVDFFHDIDFMDWSVQIQESIFTPPLYLNLLNGGASSLSGFVNPVYIHDLRNGLDVRDYWFDFSYNGLAIDTVWINPSYQRWYICTSAGPVSSGTFSVPAVSNNVGTVSSTRITVVLSDLFYFGSFNPFDLNDFISSRLNINPPETGYPSNLYVCFSFGNGLTFPIPVKTLKVGTSFASAVPVQSIDDLNFDDTYKTAYIDNPTVPVSLDLAGLARDLVDSLDIREAVISNLIDLSTDLPVNPSLVVPQEITVSAPSGSGIFFDSGFFSNISKYITYLWNMTKPLVEFARDLLVGFTVVDSEGNAVGGLSWVVYGVISVGLCAGIVVKFLE